MRAGNFFPDHTRPSHKNWSGMSGGWSGVWCECSLCVFKSLDVNNAEDIAINVAKDVLPGFEHSVNGSIFKTLYIQN